MGSLVGLPGGIPRRLLGGRMGGSAGEPSPDALHMAVRACAVGACMQTRPFAGSPLLWVAVDCIDWADLEDDKRVLACHTRAVLSCGLSAPCPYAMPEEAFRNCSPSV